MVQWHGRGGQRAGTRRDVGARERARRSSSWPPGGAPRRYHAAGRRGDADQHPRATQGPTGDAAGQKF